jgi:cobalamin biosynthesis protein CobD/CbiB
MYFGQPACRFDTLALVIPTRFSFFALEVVGDAQSQNMASENKVFKTPLRSR